MRHVAMAVMFALVPSIALAANCKRTGSVVTCDDGRTGIFAGDAIVWPDGTRSSSVKHPSVHIGHKDSVRVGPGVFVGSPSGKRLGSARRSERAAQARLCRARRRIVLPLTDSPCMYSSPARPA